MSGYKAFASFVNYMSDSLEPHGITVVTEKDDALQPPYVVLQAGPDDIRNQWLSALLCQGWVVVAKQSTEPLAVTIGKAVDTVLSVSTDPGQLAKYDYTSDPPVQIGTFIVKAREVTQDMSTDPLRASKVITWELNSNSK